MDDLARDIAERSANAERNKYLVDQYYPKDRDAGKQEDSVTVDVRVRWQSADGQEHWHRTYVTTLTLAECREKPDTLFKLLTRCLPFKEWKYVDNSCGEFKYHFYAGECTEEEQEEAEYWWEGFGQDCLFMENLTEADVKERLRDIVLDDHWGFSANSLWTRGSDRSWWFVLSTVPAHEQPKKIRGVKT